MTQHIDKSKTGKTQSTSDRKPVTRANRWFRFYSEVRNDTKILRLTLDERWKWVVALCVATEHVDGIIPGVDDMALHWRCSIDDADHAYQRLVAAKLLEMVQGEISGDRGYAPHNWARRQYVGADSTTRSRKRREKTKRTRCNGEATARQRRGNERSVYGYDSVTTLSNPTTVVAYQEENSTSVGSNGGRDRNGGAK